MQLADRDRHIVVNYREKARRATATVDAVRAAGGDASAMQADLTDEQAVVAMLDAVRQRFGRLDVLVLNASGGIERGADPGYAMRINRDAQVGLVRLALPLMGPGGRIIFVTSHQAHFSRRDPVPAGYEPIAASKRAGEDDLRGLKHTFEAHGVTFVVVCGDMVEGTAMVRQFERSNPDAVAARRAAAPLPTVAEFAGVIARAAVGPEPDGDTIYVGGRDYLRPRP